MKVSNIYLLFWFLHFLMECLIQIRRKNVDMSYQKKYNITNDITAEILICSFIKYYKMCQQCSAVTYVKIIYVYSK